MQQSMAFLYLFNSIIREVGSINITLGHLLFEVTSEKLGEKEAQFNCFDGSCIWGFGNA